MSKNVVETEGLQMTSQYGAHVLRVVLVRLYARMCMNTFTRPGTHMHAGTRKHAHTEQYTILIAFSQQQWFCERASVLRYTYIAYLVCIHVRITVESLQYATPAKEKHENISVCQTWLRAKQNIPLVPSGMMCPRIFIPDV
jgi:hypothetical protein